MRPPIPPRLRCPRPLAVVQSPRRAAAIALLALALGASGCGGDDSPQRRPPPERPAAVAFPDPGGRTLGELRRRLGRGPELAPSVSVLEPGRNRFGFALFDEGRRQIARAPVALYVSRARGERVEGPFLARWEPLAVAPRFRSQSVVDDLASATSVYTASLPFPRPGRYAVLGVARIGGALVATEPVAAKVSSRSPVPPVGERAPRISTPTRASVRGGIEQIETRVPPDTMHEVDFADALGKRPIVLIFATPALCQSRVCGPVVDIAEEVKSTAKGDTAFVHMEVFQNNRLAAGVRPQVRRFGLPTEPWVFAIDRRGRIAARLEGAFSARELREAVAAAERG